MTIKHKTYTEGVSQNYYNYIKQVKKQFLERNEDYFHANFGYEGSGKSTLLLRSCLILDPDFNVLEQTPYTQEQFKNTINNNQPGQAVLADEGQEFFYRRDAMKSENRKAIKKLKRCREQNQAIFTNLPDPGDLDKAVWPRVQAVTFCYRRPKGVFKLWVGKKTISNIKKMALKGCDMEEVSQEIDADAVFHFNRIPASSQIWKNYQDIKAKGTIDDEEDEEEDEKTANEIANELKEDKDRLKKFIKKRAGRYYINKGYLEGKLEIGGKRSKQVKELLENECNLRNIYDE